MKLLQRQILWELLRVFTLLLLGLTVMLVFVGLLQHTADQPGLGVRVLHIMPYIVPSLLPFTIPATLLLAVTVVYGRMAGDLEVTAAKAAGIHPLKLLMPAFALGSVLTVASFGLTNRAIPWAITNIETIITQAMEDIFLDLLGGQHYISDPWEGYSITVQEVRDRELIKPTIRFRDSNHNQLTMKSERATVKFDVTDRKVKLRLEEARATMSGGQQSGRFVEHELEFDLQQELGPKKPRHLTIDELQDEIARLSKKESLRNLQHDQEMAMLLMTGDFDQLEGTVSKQIAREERFAALRKQRIDAEIHSRYAMAGSCFFFALLGGPFAVVQARRQFITSFIMVFLPILLVYYPTTFLVANLAKTGTVDAWWSAWIPNLLLAAAAYFVLRRVIRH